MLFGAKELGKTTILFEIAHALLTQTPLWGQLAPTLKVEKVVYIMGEHHKELAKAQWRKMWGAEEINMVGIPPGAHHLFRGMILPRTVARLAEAVKGAGLVLFDPLSAFMDGEGVENDPTAMRGVLNAMIQVAGDGVVGIGHHEGKPAYDQRSGKWVDSSTPRGASTIGDAAASIWRLTPYRPGHEAHRFRLVKWWYKGEAPPWYDLKRDPQTLRHTLVKTGQRETLP